ncbi:MAG TPA: Uma2 family endonuclease [Bellilinea sp.]|mgnify:FL=1|nr:Uma2 family endonuclease [Bellilinea sp.]
MRPGSSPTGAHYFGLQTARRPARERYVDRAVEAVAPSDARRKVIDYLRAGTRLVWVVYPETQTVDVYRSGQDVWGVEAQGVLQGEEVLPGFELPLRELFAALEG